MPGPVHREKHQVELDVTPVYHPPSGDGVRRQNPRKKTVALDSPEFIDAVERALEIIVRRNR